MSSDKGEVKWEIAGVFVYDDRIASADAWALAFDSTIRPTPSLVGSRDSTECFQTCAGCQTLPEWMENDILDSQNDR
jgi:hypothetical protein